MRITAQDLRKILLEFPCMAACGVAYIVNLAHIRSLSRKTLEFRDNRTINVPRGAYDDLRQKYFNYY